MERINLHVSYRLADRKLLNCNYEIQKYSFSVLESSRYMYEHFVNFASPPQLRTVYNNLIYLSHVPFSYYFHNAWQRLLSGNCFACKCFDDTPQHWLPVHASSRLSPCSLSCTLFSFNSYARCTIFNEKAGV